jgi:acyl-CoA dehydrogenase
MLRELSPRARELHERLVAFMDQWVYPNEVLHSAQVRADRWRPPPIVEDLKVRAKAVGLWNLFLPRDPGVESAQGPGAGLANLEYAPLSKIMGRVQWSREVFNCSAPHTGNMEVLVSYGTAPTKKAIARAAPGRNDPIVLRDELMRHV